MLMPTRTLLSKADASRRYNKIVRFFLVKKTCIHARMNNNFSRKLCVIKLHQVSEAKQQAV